jgi:hypothetical protein
MLLTGLEKIADVLDEYGKHTALNAGQAAHDLRYLFNHPGANAVADKGTLQHKWESAKRRIPSFAQNAFYAAIPPHWHHTDENLKLMDAASAKEWFLHGYDRWKHPDPLAHLNAHLPPEEEKAAGVLAHIAGPSGSGKTTLLKRLEAEQPGLTTKDLDSFYFRARAGLPKDSSTWTDAHHEQLHKSRNDKLQGWLGEHGDEPIVVGGHHQDSGDRHHLEPPGGQKLLLDTSPARSAWRRYQRSQGNRDESKRQPFSKLWENWKEGRKDVAELKGMGYEPLSADDIVARIKRLAS